MKGDAVTSYFVLCFALAWAVWIPAGLLTPDSPAPVLVGAWAPTVAALLLTWRAEGRSGVRTLLRALLRWRVGAGYYAFAIFALLGVVALGLGVHVLLGGSPPTLADAAARFGFAPEDAHLFLAISPLVFLTTVFTGGPIAEELGWRGYAQPRLQARLGAGPAGLVIGLVWSLWHLPMFRFFPFAVAGLPLLHYVALVTALGVLFAWLYNRTGGSVLLCMLLHGGVNFALGVLGGELLSRDRRLLTIVVVLVGALALVLYARTRSLREVPDA